MTSSKEDKTVEQWVDEHPKVTTFILVAWALVLISVLTWVIHNDYTGAYDVGSVGNMCDCSCTGSGGGSHRDTTVVEE